jgi:hypothetical protein
MKAQIPSRYWDSTLGTDCYSNGSKCIPVGVSASDLCQAVDLCIRGGVYFSDPACSTPVEVVSPACGRPWPVAPVYFTLISTSGPTWCPVYSQKTYLVDSADSTVYSGSPCSAVPGGPYRAATEVPLSAFADLGTVHD